MPTRSDYLDWELLNAMAKAINRGITRSTKSFGVSGNKANKIVSPKPDNIAARVPRAEIDLPINLIIRMGPNDAPVAAQANRTLE